VQAVWNRQETNHSAYARNPQVKLTPRLRQGIGAGVAKVKAPG